MKKNKGLPLYLYIAIIVLCLSSCDTRSVVRENVIYDLKATYPSSAVFITGLGDMERSVGTNTVSEWRWAYGNKTSITFINQKEEKGYITTKICNPIAGQQIKISINGSDIHIWENIPGSESMRPTLEGHFTIDLAPGINVLEIQYAKWNGFNAVVTKDDTRPFAAAFFELRVAK